MDIGYALSKAIIQGLAEFLPVSSTAHLIFTDALAAKFGWFPPPKLLGEAEFYDIMLHLGTLGAVLWFFRADLAQMARQLGQSLVAASRGGSDPPPAEDAPAALAGVSAPRLFLYLILSMSVTVAWVLACLKGSGVAMASMQMATPHMANVSDFFMLHPQLVALHLFITGTLLWLTERRSGKPAEVEAKGPGAIGQPAVAPRLTLRHVLTIGWAQGMSAIFHGLSRSGSTISAGLATGLDRVTATRYSFLLSIPTFLAAAVYEWRKLSELGHLGQLDWPVMLLGAVVAGVVGYVCVRGFLHYVARHRLYGFAAYCWVMSVLMFTLFTVK